MRIAGRKEEIAVLQSCYESGKPEFVALYGRRRIGKTFLVEQLFGKEFKFHVSGVIDGTKDDEIHVFYNALKASGYSGEMPTTWYDAFSALRLTLRTKLSKGRRCILFIDELPCFDTPKSNFLNAFGNFWNEWCTLHPQVMLIVCGSATTWMTKNIINSHGGLHNRMTRELRLHPFSLLETEQYLRSNGIQWGRLSIVQAYSILGGVPYYLSLIRNDESVSQAIDRIFFARDGDMQDEFGRLFNSLYKSPEPYIRLIGILCKNKSGLSRDEIVAQLGHESNGHLTECLCNLEKCDFIRRYHVMNRSGRKLKKSGGIYQMIDFFTIFHFTFLTRQTTDVNYWSHHMNTPEQNTWMGLAFERVCMCHVEAIKKALGVSAISSEYFSWRSVDTQPAAQIDLVIKRADGVTNVCEMKYSEGEYCIQKSEEMKLRNRVEAYRTESGTRSAIVPVLVTTYGLRRNIHSGFIRSVIVMDDLFV